MFVTELRVVSRSQRRAMIDREEPKLSLVRQCALLGISRSSLYYLPTEAGAMMPGGADCLVPLSEVQSGPLPCLDIETATHRFDHRVPNTSNPLH